MKNKKLLSVLVSAVLLCACIAGVFMMGTSAETVTTTYTVGADGYATIKDALHAAADQEWASNAALVIKFTGEDKSALVTDKTKLEGESTNLLFGQTTIFNVDGKKLPITIKGTDADLFNNVITFNTNSANSNPKHFAFANDYVFEDLYFAAAKNVAGEAMTFIYAGSGNVEFQNVKFKLDSFAWNHIDAGATSNLSGRAFNFNGDNFTMDAFAGWENSAYVKNGETIRTSITFGKNTEYFPGYDNRSSSKMNAVGYRAGFNPDLSAYTDPAEAVAAAKELAAKIEYKPGELVTANCAVKPIDTEAAFIVDSGEQAHNGTSFSTTDNFGPVRARAEKNSNLANTAGDSPVSNAIVEIRSGHVFSVSLSDNSTSNDAFNYVGDITINILGGVVGLDAQVVNGYSLNLTRGANIVGDFTLNISGENEKSTYVTRLFSTLGNATQAKYYGTYTFNMSGGTVGKDANTEAGIAGTQNYGVMGMQGTITNITGGKINGNYYAAFLNQGKGGTIPADKIPAAYREYIDGSVDIYNYVGPNANVETFIGGYWDSDQTVTKSVGNIVNVVNGDGVTHFIPGNYHGQTVTGKRDDTGFGNLTNIITGGTFEEVFFGKNGADDYGSTKTIKNVVLGGTFYGFCGGSIYNTRREVTNIIKEGTFNRSTTGFETNGTDLTKLAYAYVGGGLRGESDHVSNTIYAANFPKTSTDNQNYIGGVLEGNCGDIYNKFDGKDAKGNIDIVFASAGSAILGNRSGSAFAITNEIDSLVITNQVFYAGSWGGSCKGITNTFTGKTSIGVNASDVTSCKSVTLGGGASSTAKFIVNGDIKNTIDCEILDATGTQNYNFGAFYAAGRYADVAGDITTEVKSGTFRTYNGGVQSGLINGDVTNTIDNAIIGNDFVGAGASSIKKLTNNISDTLIINHAYLGGNATVANIENNLTGAIDFRRNVYGAGNGSALVVTGNVVNKLEMTTLSGNANNMNVFYGGARDGDVNGTIQNTYNSGKMATYIGGHFDDTVGSAGAIVNNINCTDFTTFDSGRGVTIGSIENNITTGSFPKTFYGGPVGKAEVGDITNNISGDVNFGTTFYAGGDGDATITGTITNAITGGTFSNLVYLGSANGNTKSIINEISGGEFKGHIYGGSQKGTVDGDITNILSGSPNFNDRIFYGGGGDSGNAITVTGSIENTINLADDCQLKQGAVGGNRNGSVAGGIHSIVNSGKLASYNGGNTTGTVAGTVKNEFGAITMSTITGAGGSSIGAIENIFNGTKLTSHAYVGNTSGVVTGNIINQINGEVAFGGNFFAAGGASGAPTTVKGTVTTTINAVAPAEGNNLSAFYGGVRDGSVQGKITNIVNSGVFNNLYGGSYSGITGTVSDVETTIKNATVNNYLRPNRNDTNNATGEVKLTIDLSEGGVVTLLNQAKSAVASDEETIILKGGAGKLVIGAKTDLVADSVIDTVNIEMTEEPVKGKVYVTIPGNVKASLNVTASEGITTPFVVVADGNTYVRGTGDSINAQLVIGEKIAVKVLFPVDFVGGFSYSWAGGSLEGTEKDLVLTNVFGKDYLALTLPALSLTEFESEFTFNAEGYEEAIFSILSLAEVAEANWTDAEWVEVAKAIQNLNAVYNHKEANTMAPNLELGAPTTVGGSLKAEVQSLNAAPVMKGGAAGLKFTLSLANAPENFVVKVGDLDVTDKCLVTVNGTKVTVEIYFSAAHGCDNANIKFMDGDAKYLHVNTSVAQIAAVSAKAGNNNAAALVAFLQSVDAANN